jgi:putative hydrolase of the HAD superfamily
MIARAHDLRAVLLDYGGTLDGDAAHWFDHFVALYARLEHPLATDVLKSAFYSADEGLTREPGVRSFGLEPMVRAHVRLQLTALDVRDEPFERQLADAFIADTRSAWARNRPLLRRLAERFRLGVVSNSYGNMPALLADADLGPFAVVVDSERVGLRKPDPAIYAHAARELDVPPPAILHVGDSWERDVVAARAAGLHAAWLARPAAAQPASPPDVWRIASLLELERLLR